MVILTKLYFMNYGYGALTEIKEIYGTEKKPLNPDTNTLASYSVKIADTLYKINERVDKELEEKEMISLYEDIELPLTEVLYSMEKEGIICGYHTLINWEKTTKEKVNALIEVRVTPQRGQGFDAIAQRIYNYPEVSAVYLMSGGYDLMVILEGQSLKEVSSFVSNKLSTLEYVLSTATHFILKQYKVHGTIYSEKKDDIREVITP